MKQGQRMAATERVVTQVRALIDRGELQSGDRLPAERRLAAMLRVSRPSVRAGLRALSAMGVVQARHGAGTFITAGPPVLTSEPLSLLAALHGFTQEQMFETRLVMEVAAAGLAAELTRDAAEHLVAISDETTGMFASMDDPEAFLDHDIRFHRAVATASGNPILAALIEMVSTLFKEVRRGTIARATDLKEAADEHRAIYQAIRIHEPARARQAMSDHLQRAQRAQAREALAHEAQPGRRARTGRAVGGNARVARRQT